jgi:predicted O-methyltransferase YrrM
MGPSHFDRILSEVLRRDEPQVLEWGSGGSTLQLALAATRRGGNLISIEHDPEWHRRVKAEVEAFPEDLNLLLDLIEAPGEYVHRHIPEGVFYDVVLVDGRSGTRRPAMRGVQKNLLFESVIFLHDSQSPRHLNNKSLYRTVTEDVDEEFENKETQLWQGTLIPPPR